ncbi:MAG: primosomal protein N' [Bacteroidales bacterium]|nr:primosomal protein N' [Bacteroidales bacterium]
MSEKTFISVIIPLKLEWTPCYYIPEAMAVESIHVGDRVRVCFARKEYIGIISEIGITPEVDAGRILPIVSIENNLERIFPQEMELWKNVAEYYMCCIGEVYKAAYPSVKTGLEESRAAARQKAMERKARICDSIRAKIEKLTERLEKKEVAAASAKDGSKKRETCIADIHRIKEEIYRAETALRSAEKEVEATHKGLSNSRIPLPESRIILNEAQTKAFNAICQGFEAGKPVLLHGITGSGKTEIYIKAAEEQLRSGKNVLYLVPEIALSRQLEDRLTGHFGNRLLIYHSAETAAKRRNTGEIIRNSDSYIILGTRSSLFLPHHDLGLIIVDEEHESSYKQDSPAPRYNGRDTALMLSTIHKGCRILLGSATPSLEELYNCKSGKHLKVDLKEKYYNGDNCTVEIIDTKAERRKNGMKGCFSRKLIGQINETLERKEQVMILRSRRAWAPALQCESCGEIVKCPHCNVSLSLHKAESERIVCHSCGYTSVFSGKCRNCSGSLLPLGSGTQRVEEEAQELFPKASIARLDSDSSIDKNRQSAIIRNFSDGNTDILIGTQIIAKGFDFSRLTLVAVIGADSLLGIQDFRADEKAIQTLEQLKGRCARRGMKGRFIIQTSSPAHPVYGRIMSGECSDFNIDLLEERKEFDFPPYSRIIEITIKDGNQSRLERLSAELAERLSEKVRITGPYSPVNEKVADMYIKSVRITLKKDRSLMDHKRVLKKVIDDFEKKYRYEGHLTINVDPI